MTFKNIELKGEFSLNERFHLMSQCFFRESIVIFSFILNMHSIALMFSKSSAANLLYFGKGGKLCKGGAYERRNSYSN